MIKFPVKTIHSFQNIKGYWQDSFKTENSSCFGRVKEGVDIELFEEYNYKGTSIKALIYGFQ